MFEWFMTIPGILVICGVLLLIIAIILLSIKSPIFNQSEKLLKVLIMVAEKIDQCMKPHGDEGIETIERMNENHKDISEFAFECVNVDVNDKILDIGFQSCYNARKPLRKSE